MSKKAIMIDVPVTHNPSMIMRNSGPTVPKVGETGFRPHICIRALLDITTCPRHPKSYHGSLGLSMTELNGSASTHCSFHRDTHANVSKLAPHRAGAAAGRPQKTSFEARTDFAHPELQLRPTMLHT